MKRHHIYFNFYLCMTLLVIACLPAVAAQDFDYWYDMGFDSMMFGEYEEAVEYYTKAIEIDPTYVFCYDDRGRAYANLGQYDLAIADFEKAIEMDPDYSSPRNSLAMTYYRMGDYENALESIKVALEIDPTSTLYNARADTYRSLGRYDEALADIESALWLHGGDDPRWIFTRGLIYRDMGDMDKAKADLEYACTGGIPEACAALEELN